MYATGMVKMVCCETEISSGKNVKSLGTRSGESGCFVLWQMLPGTWSLELVVGGNKVVAGSDGKIVWRHTPWLGTHAAKGPQRPLRRIIQVTFHFSHYTHLYCSNYICSIFNIRIYFPSFYKDTSESDRSESR